MTEELHVSHHDISSVLGKSLSPFSHPGNDTDLPIALRKGARYCLKYHVVNLIKSNHQKFSLLVLGFFIQEYARLSFI